MQPPRYFLAALFYVFIAAWIEASRKTAALKKGRPEIRSRVEP